MIALLFLGHALLGIVGLFLARSESVSRRALLIVGSLGASLGVALFFLRHSGFEWRTTSIEPGPAVAAGLAAAAAWVLIATAGRDRVAGLEVPLVGVASTGLILFSLNKWTIPALIFWVVASISLAYLVRAEPGRAQVWFALALSDALVIVGLLWHVVDAKTWKLPASAEGLT